MGLLIDYDKDDKSKRESEFHKAQKRQERDELVHFTPIFCLVCAAEVIRIRFPYDRTVSWESLPRDRSCQVLDLRLFQCVLRMKEVHLAGAASAHRT